MYVVSRQNRVTATAAADNDADVLALRYSTVLEALKPSHCTTVLIVPEFDGEKK